MNNELKEIKKELHRIMCEYTEMESVFRIARNGAEITNEDVLDLVITLDVMFEKISSLSSQFDASLLKLEKATA